MLYKIACTFSKVESATSPLVLTDLLCSSSVRYVVALVIKLFGNDQFIQDAERYNNGNQGAAPSSPASDPLQNMIWEVKKLTQQFHEFAEINKTGTSVKFVVAEEAKIASDTSCIFVALYEDGRCVSSDFRCPSAPEDLKVTRCYVSQQVRNST